MVYLLLQLIFAATCAYGYNLNWRTRPLVRPLSKQSSAHVRWTGPHHRALSFRLDAKPKFSKYISEELLASLDKEHAEPGPGAISLTEDKTEKKSKKQSKAHKHITGADVKAVLDGTTGSGSAVDEREGFGSTAAEVSRKKSPSSRIRFVESSQPDFVSIGLDKVGLRFGDTVVLKDATLTVSTGERVGLVGPNGGGKVSVLPCALYASFWAC